MATTAHSSTVTHHPYGVVTHGEQQHKNRDWNVGNQNPAFGGRLVLYAGMNVTKAEVKWPRTFVPTMLREIGLV
jgi:hypothetical protein